MPRVFLGNFDFEHELAAGRKWQSGVALRRINAELACVWLAEARPEDVIITPLPIEAESLKDWTGLFGRLPQLRTVVKQECCGWELVPWGWSAQAVEWGMARGLNCRHPLLEIVREVNDRLFSYSLETEWGVGLTGSAIIRSIEELRQQFDHVRAERWVLKARFGMSGRERLLGRSSELPEASLSWLESRLARDGAVIFEPWVEKIAEAGIQWEIPNDGPPQFLGLMPLLSDAQGGYRGNRLNAEPPQISAEWQFAVDTTRKAAERAQQLGYFGPLGIDVMRYRAVDGSIQVRPMQDINARWTMGRLTLGWGRLLAKGECGTWLHFARRVGSESNREFERKQQVGRPPAHCRIWQTSPQFIDGTACRHASVLIVAKNEDARTVAEEGFAGDTNNQPETSKLPNFPSA